MRTATERLVCKAARSAYIVFGLIFGFLTLMTGIAASADRTMVAPFVGCAAAWAVIYLWLARVKLTLKENSLTYRTLWAGTRAFDLEQIQNIEIESGVGGYSDRFKPFVRLAISPKEGVALKPLYVNLKVLGGTSVRHLIDALRIRYHEIGHPEVVRHL
jgi:hypothetical protein